MAAVTLDDKYTLEKGRVYLTGTQALVRLPLLQRQRDVGGRAQYGLLYFRLSRLAARRVRPGAVERAPLCRAQPHQVPAGDQRGTGRHRGVGQPADRAVSRRQIRRRFRRLVRQGAGGRPQRRRAEARQLGRHRAAWRGAGAGRRRSHLQILDPGAPVGIRVYRRADPGAEPGRGRGHSRSRPLRLGDVALFRLLGGAEDRRRDDGQLGLDLGRSRAGRDRPARGFRDAAGRAQHPLARPAARPGSPAAPLQDPGGDRLRPRQPARPHRDRRAAAALRHRHDRKILSRRAAGAGRTRHRRGRSRGAGPAALQGRDAVAARTRRHAAASPRGSTRCWSSRKSAPSSRRSSRSSSTTGPPTGGRASSANSTRAGDWILPSNGELSPAQIARVIARRLAALGAPAVARRAGRPRSTRASGRPAAAMSCRSPARRISAPAARTTPRPACRKAAARWPGSAAITCRNSWTATPRPSPRWAARARRGSGRRRLSRRTHVFANIGDGTYTHSGILAIRAAVAAGVTMTYKVLFNDAVAMTGGQPLDGGLTVPRVAAQLAAEGVQQVVIVSDEPRQIPARHRIPARRDGAAPRRARSGAARIARDRRRHRDRLRPDLRRRKAPPPQARPLPGPADSGSLSTIWFARAAATARRPRTACRSCRSRPNSAASARSTSRAATRIFPASRASARAL